MSKYPVYIITALFFTLLQSCKNDGPDVSGIQTSTSITRLGDKMLAINSEKELSAFFNEEEHLLKHYFQGPEEAVTAKVYKEVLSNEDFQQCFEKTLKEFESLDNLREEFDQAFKHIKYYYPQFEEPKIYTLFSGFLADLFINKESVYISLEFFAEDKEICKPPFPVYMSERLTKAFIVPYAVNYYFSEEFIKTDLSDQSLLAEMIYWGKKYYFTKQIIPGIEERLIYGYTPEQVEAITANERFIWDHFVSNQLFYKNDPSVIEDYIGERPKVVEISDNCPGRVGRWLGYKIVSSYMEKNDVSLTELMNESDAQTIFTQSKYKPKAQ